jgi:hypothetical protein
MLRLGPRLGLRTREEPMFAIKQWNHFEDVRAGDATTNNSSEGNAVMSLTL